MPAVLWTMLIMPVLYFIFGSVLLFRPPKRNGLFGYRTRTSLKNDDNWAYANKICGASMLLSSLFCAIALCIINCCVENFFHALFSDAAVVIFSLIIAIPVTEIKLRLFDAKNNKKNESDGQSL